MVCASPHALQWQWLAWLHTRRAARNHARSTRGGNPRNARTWPAPCSASSSPAATRLLLLGLCLLLLGLCLLLLLGGW